MSNVLHGGIRPYCGRPFAKFIHERIGQIIQGSEVLWIRCKKVPSIQMLST